MSIMETLKKPVFKLDGITVTVALILIIVVLFFLYKKMKRG